MSCMGDALGKHEFLGRTARRGSEKVLREPCYQGRAALQQSRVSNLHTGGESTTSRRTCLYSPLMAGKISTHVGIEPVGWPTRNAEPGTRNCCEGDPMFALPSNSTSKFNDESHARAETMIMTIDTRAGFCTDNENSVKSAARKLLREADSYRWDILECNVRPRLPFVTRSCASLIA